MYIRVVFNCKVFIHGRKSSTSPIDYIYPPLLGYVCWFIKPLNIINYRYGYILYYPIVNDINTILYR